MTSLWCTELVKYLCLMFVGYYVWRERLRYSESGSLLISELQKFRKYFLSWWYSEYFLGKSSIFRMTKGPFRHVCYGHGTTKIDSQYGHKYMKCSYCHRSTYPYLYTLKAINEPFTSTFLKDFLACTLVMSYETTKFTNYLHKYVKEFLLLPHTYLPTYIHCRPKINILHFFKKKGL